MGAQAVRLSNIDIDNALKNKDFEVLFQPIFDLSNGALARMETFVRWRHASLGVLPPGAFISFFETQGRMGELTRYVLDEALDGYVGWRGASAPGFSINLALSDLADDSLSSHLVVALRQRSFPAELVTLECPMPPVTMNDATSAAHFARLQETGARLAIEVRGRANEFLRNLDPFPFAEIKTGGAAILRFARTVRGPGLSAISELLELANRHNAAITAVGVEDQASLAALKGLGFAAAQGNHLGKVGPVAGFTPSRVNEVRELLDLQPLSREDLAALFRTGAPDVAAPPAPKVKKTAAVAAKAAPADTSDDLIERLAARISLQEAAATGGKPVIDEATRSRARKAAAIARARRRAALAQASDASEDEPESAPPAAPALAPGAGWAKKSAAAAPRDMQERLSREFEAFADQERASASPVAQNDEGDDWSMEGDELFPDESARADSQEEDVDADAQDRNDAVDATLADVADAPDADDDVEDVDIDDRVAATENSSDAEDEAEAPLSIDDAPMSAQGQAYAPVDAVAEPAEEAQVVSEQTLFEFATMSISGANARFVPGVHVGGPAAPPPRLRTPAPSPEPQDDAPRPAFGRAAPAAPPAPPVAAEPLGALYDDEVEHADDDAQARLDLPPEPAVGRLEEFTLDDVDDLDETPVARRRNGFLGRTVIRYRDLKAMFTTRFWPRWVRRWLRARRVVAAE